MVPSATSPYIQIADVIIGVIVGALAGSRYALDLFEVLIHHFLWKPREKAVYSASSYTSGVIGYGLKVFLRNCSQIAYRLLSPYDTKYIIINDGLRERESV